MKNKYILITLFLIVNLFACNEEFLEEKPLDFIAAENAFETYSDFQLSVNNLYKLVRREFYGRDENYPMDYIYGTDLVFDGQPSVRRFTPYTSSMQPSGGANIPRTHWQDLYKIVAESNTIISRLEEASLSDAEKKQVEAEAKFFRAFTYRTLAYLFGGVPLSLEEVKSPRYDYTRATKKEVLEQCIADANFAAENLKGASEVQDGQINPLIAQHLLAELYLANDEPQKAITAATIVIDDPNTALMQERFGSRANEEPGDVYWDLYRRQNQNRAAGNTEGIWVIQFELDIIGGSLSSTGRGGAALYERHHPPMVRDYSEDGKRLFSWPMGDYTGGRGIGWAVSTTYFTNTIWESDWDNDIRNANHNFVREYVYTNKSYPDSFGKTVSTENPPAGVTVPSRAFYAYQSKVTTPFNHPSALYANSESVALKSSAGATYTDQYMFRLAETYLLRAEAYLKAGNAGAAAADINAIRNRVNAAPVSGADVDIEYILDERMRELGIEEKRRLTLMRLGLLYDRVKKCNPYYETIEPHHNLWPIPFSEIERNTEAEITQNPGYLQ
ncbi:RagB/SusD family nutrient uptake outer membrane protein [Flammeovirgaceae bacterium SG7u.111]|nr:RagB/SusD family nutrient uptake outer membrane protein [Flammeovirgaceae bacterium SG7u.132]WPO38523.1 RagB/SusD family nutrient uptake outer membrane protein [Flammeovirgaceae bacterium SG7u.111]